MVNINTALSKMKQNVNEFAKILDKLNSNKDKINQELYKINQYKINRKKEITSHILNENREYIQDEKNKIITFFNSISDENIMLSDTTPDQIKNQYITLKNKNDHAIQKKESLLNVKNEERISEIRNLTNNNFTLSDISDKVLNMKDFKEIFPQILNMIYANTQELKEQMKFFDNPNMFSTNIFIENIEKYINSASLIDKMFNREKNKNITKIKEYGTGKLFAEIKEYKDLYQIKKATEKNINNNQIEIDNLNKWIDKIKLQINTLKQIDFKELKQNIKDTYEDIYEKETYQIINQKINQALNQDVRYQTNNKQKIAIEKILSSYNETIEKIQKSSKNIQKIVKKLQSAKSRVGGYENLPSSTSKKLNDISVPFNQINEDIDIFCDNLFLILNNTILVDHTTLDTSLNISDCHIPTHTEQDITNINIDNPIHALDISSLDIPVPDISGSGIDISIPDVSIPDISIPDISISIDTSSFDMGSSIDSGSFGF